MRPTTSGTTTGNTTSNLFFEPESLVEEDCRFLLRTLEKQAFEHVLYAFRAQGPLTQYKELLLEHIKSALFINDDEFTVKARIAANNPYLLRIAQELNPSYDNFSEWIAAGYDLTGVDLAIARRQSLEQNNAQIVGQTSQILKEIHRHNSNLLPECDGLAQLTRLPKRPFVPERLRRFLQDSEADVNGRIDTLNEKQSAGPSSNLKMHSSPQPRRPVRNGVGRPRKYQQRETANSVENRQKNPLQTTKSLTENNGKKKMVEKPNSPEEQAVLAILARTSAQMTREAAERAAMLQQMPSTSTSTTAMDNLVESALNRGPEFIHPQLRPSILSKMSSTFESGNVSSGLLSATASKPLQSTPLPFVQNQNVPETNNIAGTMKNNGIITNNVGTTLGPGQEAHCANANGNAAKLLKKRSNVSRPVNAGTTSARVRPFIFQRAVSGKAKPLRGNPDKQLAPLKRPNSQQDNNHFAGNIPPMPMTHTYYQRYLPNANKYYNNQPSMKMKTIDVGGPPKRVHLLSEMPGDFMSTENNSIQHLNINPTVVQFANANPATFQMAPTHLVVHATSTATFDHSYERNSHITPMVKMVENNVEPTSPSTIIVVNTIPSTAESSSLQTNIQQNGLNRTTPMIPNVLPIPLPSTSQCEKLLPYYANVQTTSKGASTPAAEPASGLDFLASTASLLTPLETAIEFGKNKEQQRL